MNDKRVVFLIGGEAGDGIFASGSILSRIFMRSGLHVFSTNEYISIIRGGHQWYSITVSDTPVYSNRYNVDFLIALNKKTIKMHKKQLKRQRSYIIADENDISEDIKGYNLVSLPTKKFLKEISAKRVMRNSIALGAVLGLLNYSLKTLKEAYKDTYPENIAEKNISLAQMGYDYIKKRYLDLAENIVFFSQKEVRDKIFVTGNEALALGALAMGLKFYVAYPMTPASSILHFLARLQKDQNIIVIQPESELAAINMAIGAAFAGVRSMTATSGGGFSLMTEALGFAAIAEIPVVIIVVQRPGPSTGIPTFTGQGDLRFVIHASQGEFPRIVIAPGDVYEAFEIAGYSLNLAWKYQLPVIILGDKFLGESGWSCERFKPKYGIDEGKIIKNVYDGRDKYKRYKITDDGISPFAILGTINAIVKANSNEHDEEGSPTYNSDKVIAMVDKRFRKRKAIIEETSKYEVVKYYGSEETEFLIISWGSPKGPILEAMKMLGDDRIGFLQIIWMEPFPKDKVYSIVSRYDDENIILIENNKTGLLNSLLNEYIHLDIKKKFLKYDGRPPYPYEIVDFIKEVIF